MRRWRVRLGTLVLVAACGCWWAKKPYANDPLVRTRRAVIANPIDCPPPDKWDRPLPPPPPK